MHTAQSESSAAPKLGKILSLLSDKWNLSWYTDERRHTKITMSSQQGRPARSDQSVQPVQWQEHVRAWIGAIAVLVAQSSLQAALSPPGGFWSDDNDGHVAGSPILADRNKRRYQVFFYLNAVSFATSLVVAIMVARLEVLADGVRLLLLEGFVVVDLLAMMGVYAAGACRDTQSTAIVVVVMGLVFLNVIWMMSKSSALVPAVWHCLSKTYECFGQTFVPHVPSGSDDAAVPVHRTRSELPGGSA